MMCTCMIYVHQVKETLSREIPKEDGEGSEERTFTRRVSTILALYTDIIGQKFWQEHPDIIGEESWWLDRQIDVLYFLNMG